MGSTPTWWPKFESQNPLLIWAQINSWPHSPLPIVFIFKSCFLNNCGKWTTLYDNGVFWHGGATDSSWISDALWSWMLWFVLLNSLVVLCDCVSLVSIDDSEGLESTKNPLEEMNAGLLDSSGQKLPLQAVNVKCKLMDLLCQVWY